MLYTRKMVEDNIRNRDKKRVFYLGSGDTLTSEARDFLQAQRIEILPATAAKKERWQILGGGFTEEKPEHMTHLNGEFLVKKTHPRIAFRGWVDALEAELLWGGKVCPHLQRELGEILALTRQILRCDVLDEPLTLTGLCGLTEAEMRKRSHFPQDYYGIPHFMPDFSDREGVLTLNRIRTVARQTELSAQHAFADREGTPTREDLLQALNRISSMLYILMLREKAAYGTGETDTKNY
jgi:ethanolamine utilization cobalamin adenosyltransferase